MNLRKIGERVLVRAIVDYGDAEARRDSLDRLVYRFIKRPYYIIKALRYGTRNRMLMMLAGKRTVVLNASIVGGLRVTTDDALVDRCYFNYGVATDVAVQVTGKRAWVWNCIAVGPGEPQTWYAGRLETRE